MELQYSSNAEMNSSTGFNNNNNMTMFSPSYSTTQPRDNIKPQDNDNQSKNMNQMMEMVIFSYIQYIHVLNTFFLLKCMAAEILKIKGKQGNDEN